MIRRESDKSDTESECDTDTGTLWIGYRLQDELPQILGTNKGADDHHEQRKNNRLIDAQHDMWKRERQFNRNPALEP